MKLWRPATRNLWETVVTVVLMDYGAAPLSFMGSMGAAAEAECDIWW